jgi:hypothetical protein
MGNRENFEVTGNLGPADCCPQSCHRIRSSIAKIVLAKKLHQRELSNSPSLESRFDRDQRLTVSQTQVSGYLVMRKPSKRSPRKIIGSRKLADVRVPLPDGILRRLAGIVRVPQDKLGPFRSLIRSAQAEASAHMAQAAAST